ncbi:hypothetical protein NMY22_g14922 [Coprinellus aureogranulatus]|nr:hypothetical protein NMY22_g14922 [Coprinellus aureogranulatus]
MEDELCRCKTSNKSANENSLPHSNTSTHPKRRKLKKAWIEKAQIKSKWSREKRKLQEEGVIPAVKKPWEIPGEEQGEGRDGDGDDDEEEEAEKGRTGSGSKDESEDESEVEEPPAKRTKRTGTEKPSIPPHMRRPNPSSSHHAPRQQRPENSNPSLPGKTRPKTVNAI